MNNNSNALFKALVSVVIGTLIGYFLWIPIFQIPLESARSFILAIARPIDPYFVSKGAGFITIALITFLLRIPNIILLALVSSLVIKFVRKPRQLLYSVLITPAVIILLYWFDVLRLKLIFENMGRPSGIEHLPTNPYFPMNSVVIFLTYSFFLALVSMIGCWYKALQSSTARISCD